MGDAGQVVSQPLGTDELGVDRGTGSVRSSAIGPRGRGWGGSRRILRGWTHKSSNGSSVPGGHSREGDHQEDDDGADTAEEVLGVGGAGSKGSRGQAASA